MAATRGSQALSEALGKKRSNKQKELSEKTGIGQSWLSRIASGGVGCRPNISDALALQREAGIPIEWWDEPPEVEPARAAGAGK